MKQPLFKIGDILSSKDKKFMGIVSFIDIHLEIKENSEVQTIKYTVKANNTAYSLCETTVIKLDEVCPF